MRSPEFLSRRTRPVSLPRSARLLQASAPLLFAGITVWVLVHGGMTSVETIALVWIAAMMALLGFVQIHRQVRPSAWNRRRLRFVAVVGAVGFFGPVVLAVVTGYLSISFTGR